MKRKAIAALLIVAALLAALAPAHAEVSASSLLRSIEKSGLKGRLMGSAFTVAQDTIEDLEDELGEADESAYIASAKGTYYTFEDAGIVAGTNKGDQVFELRCYDSALSAIRLKDVKKYFGKPDHVTTTKTERFVSYRITDELNLKFCFSAKGSNPTLTHYCVFYPKGTVNMMADDPGRKW